MRIINLSLLGVYWYVDQLRHKNNDADAIELSIPSNKIRGDVRDYMQFYDSHLFDQKQAYNLSDVMKFVFSDDSKAQVQMQNGESMNYWPVQVVKVPVNADACKAQGIEAPNDTTKFPNEVIWKMKTSGMILKNDIMTLDIIAANNWKTPDLLDRVIKPRCISRFG